MERERLNDIEPDAVASDDALECYRSGRDDLRDPGFATLAARLAADQNFAQRLERVADFDRSVQAAFVDVPVPPDLVANTLSRLTDSAAPAPVKVTVATVKTPRELDSHRPPITRPPITRPPITRRRTFLALVGFAGTAAAVVLGVVWGLQRPHAVTPSSLLEEAITTFAHETADHPQGVLVSTTSPPVDLPFSTDLRPLRGKRWRNVDGFLGGQAVAYDLPVLNGARATLYVSHGTVPGLMPFAPVQPTGNTGGCSAGAWEVGGTLYVLVVEGDNRAYRSYLDLSHGPIA